MRCNKCHGFDNYPALKLIHMELCAETSYHKMYIMRFRFRRLLKTIMVSILKKYRSIWGRN